MKKIFKIKSLIVISSFLILFLFPLAAQRIIAQGPPAAITLYLANGGDSPAYVTYDIYQTCAGGGFVAGTFSNIGPYGSAQYDTWDDPDKGFYCVIWQPSKIYAWDPRDVTCEDPATPLTASFFNFVYTANLNFSCYIPVAPTATPTPAAPSISSCSVLSSCTGTSTGINISWNRSQTGWNYEVWWTGSGGSVSVGDTSTYSVLPVSSSVSLTGYVRAYLGSNIGPTCTTNTITTLNCAPTPTSTPTPTPNPCAGVTCASPPTPCYNSSGTCVPSGSTYSCSYTYKAAGTSCNADSNACTVGDTCNGAGTCNAGTAITCTNGTECTNAGTCNPATGTCGTGTNKAAGTSCNADSNACTVGDTCNGAGTCNAGTATVCNNGTQCTNAGTCNPATGTCGTGTNKAAGTSCNDSVACTTPDTCNGAGTCTGPSIATTCVLQGKNCGTIPDGCGAGGTLNCGTCTAPETCGGGGVPNVCGSGATILGKVYNDIASPNPNNGILDAGDSGLAGSIVRLNAAGGPVGTPCSVLGAQIGSSITTPANGDYSFTGITTPGNYCVSASVPAGYLQSTIDITNPKTVTIPNPATGAFTANFAMRQIPATCTDLTSNPTSVYSEGTSTLTANGCTGTPTFNWPPPSCVGGGGSVVNVNSNTSTFTAPNVCNTTTCTATVNVTNTSGVTNPYSTNITVNPNAVITGYVYADTAGNNCGAGKTAVPSGVFTIRHGAVSGPTCTTNASGTCNITDTTDPCNVNRTITLSSVDFTKVLGVRLDGSASFDTSGNLVGFQYKLPSDRNDHIVDFCVTSTAPWFQTTTGDVRTSSKLVNAVPLNKNATDDVSNPSVFYSSQDIASFGKGTSSGKGWVINNEFGYQSDTENRYGTAAYTYYLSRASNTSTLITTSCDNLAICNLSPSVNGVYKVIAPLGGEVTINYTHPSGKHIVVLVDGNVRISSTIKVPSNADNLFILATNGNITIDKNLGEAVLTSVNTNIEGILTAEKNIVIESKDNGCTNGIADLRLNVGGVLVANALKPFARSGAGQLINNRSLCGGDIINPSYMVQQRLDFITRLADFYKIPVTRWREVNP